MIDFYVRDFFTKLINRARRFSFLSLRIQKVRNVETCAPRLDVDGLSHSDRVRSGIDV
jgi:hypothetical protein